MTARWNRARVRVAVALGWSIGKMLHLLLDRPQMRRDREAMGWSREQHLRDGLFCLCAIAVVCLEAAAFAALQVSK